MTDAWRIKREVPDFEEGVDYTQRELHLLAEKILLVDPKDSHDHPAYLPMGQFRERQKREVYVATGVPDPSWVSGMYWRTHPEGRTFQTKDNTNSFYR